jgi:hypothetical protein
LLVVFCLSAAVYAGSMPPSEMVRPGPDAATTDLVFREKGGSGGQAVLVALAAVASVSILFGGAGCLIFLSMVVFGAGSAKALSVAGLFAAAASLITGPFVVAKELRRVRRVQFVRRRRRAGSASCEPVAPGHGCLSLT